MRKVKREGNGEYWRFEKGDGDFDEVEEGLCQREVSFHKLCGQPARWKVKCNGQLLCPACRELIQHKALWLKDGSQELENARQLRQEPDFAVYKQVRVSGYQGQKIALKQQVFQFLDEGRESEAYELVGSMAKLRPLIDEWWKQKQEKEGGKE